MRCGERRSFPAGATLISPGRPASGLLGRRPLRLKNGPQIRLRLRGPQLRALLTTPAPFFFMEEHGRRRSLSEPPYMWSQYVAGASLVQQPPELESSEGETAGTPPPASWPPGACRRRSQQRHRKGQKATAGHPGGGPLISVRVNQGPPPPELP